MGELRRRHTANAVRSRTILTIMCVGLTWKSGEGATNLRMQLDWRSIKVIAVPLVVRDSRM